MQTIDKEISNSLGVATFTPLTNPKSLESNARNAQKTIANISCKLALFVVEQTKNLECGNQQVVIEKFLFHLLIKNME